MQIKCLTRQNCRNRVQPSYYFHHYTLKAEVVELRLVLHSQYHTEHLLALMDQFFHSYLCHISQICPTSEVKIQRESHGMKFYIKAQN